MGVDIAFGPRMNQRCGLKKYISYLKGSYLYRDQTRSRIQMDHRSDRQTISNNFKGCGRAYYT